MSRVSEIVSTGSQQSMTMNEHEMSKMCKVSIDDAVFDELDVSSRQKLSAAYADIVGKPVCIMPESTFLKDKMREKVATWCMGDKIHQVEIAIRKETQHE